MRSKRKIAHKTAVKIHGRIRVIPIRVFEFAYHKTVTFGGCRHRKEKLSVRQIKTHVYARFRLSFYRVGNGIVVTFFLKPTRL